MGKIIFRYHEGLGPETKEPKVITGSIYPSVSDFFSLVSVFLNICLFFSIFVLAWVWPNVVINNSDLSFQVYIISVQANKSEAQSQIPKRNNPAWFSLGQLSLFRPVHVVMRADFVYKQDCHSPGSQRIGSGVEDISRGQIAQNLSVIIFLFISSVLFLIRERVYLVVKNMSLGSDRP